MKQQNTPYSTAARYNEALSPEEIEIKCGTYSDTYTGSREDLIKAGLATADMFPVSLKRKKYLIGPGITRLGVTLIIKRKRAGRFELTRYHEERKLPDPPLTVEIYRMVIEHQADMLNTVLTIANGKVNRNNPKGYQFAEAEINAISSHLSAIKRILLTGRLIEKQ